MSALSPEESPPLGQVPSLVIPFAAAGVAAVWFLLDDDANLVAMALAALTTGAAGGILTSHCRRSALGAFPRRTLGLRLTLLILASGLVTGFGLGALEGWPGSAVNGLVAGLFCAPVALPLHGAVLWLALRAERPRHRSIVARSELRAIAAVLLAVFALLAARRAGVWRMTPEGYEPVSWGAYAVACCVAALSLGLLTVDVADLRRVTRLARDRTLETCPEGNSTAARLDLGFGDEAVAHMARGAAYRTALRAVAVVQGSFPRTLRALRLAVARDLAVAVVAGVAVFVHASERTDAARAAHVAYLAGRGEPAACVEHARWLEANEGAASRAHVTELYDKACMGGIGAACEEAAARYEAHGALERAAQVLSHECDMEVVRACHSAGVLLVRAGVEPTLAFDRFLKACVGGVPEACCEGAYLAHHGEGARYMAANSFSGRGALGHGEDEPAAGARHARDLYRRAVAAGRGGDARCVALRSEGFAEGSGEPGSAPDL